MLLLPKWVLPSPFPSIFDLESHTPIEMTAKLYGAMNTLIDEYNKFADSVNAALGTFTEEETTARAEFEADVTKVYRQFMCQMENYLKVNLYDTSLKVIVEGIESGSVTYPTDKTLKKEGLPAESAAVGVAIANSDSNMLVKTAELAAALAVERERINNLVANNGSATEGNAELIDIRLDYKGVTHATAGEAVRSQVASLDGRAERLAGKSETTLETTWSMGSIGSANGYEGSQDNRCRTGYMPIDDIVAIPGGMKIAVYFYDGAKTYLEDYTLTLQTGSVFVQELAPADAVYYRFVVAYADDSNITNIEAATAQVKFLTNTRLYVDEKVEAVKKRIRETECEVYTEFEWLPGWWLYDGGITYNDENTWFHTNLIPVKPGNNYYLGYLNKSTTPTGAFFDKTGEWIDQLKTGSITAYSYKIPDGNNGNGLYVELYKFTAPEGAAFFSYNLSGAEDRTYRQFVSSKPIFMLAGTGNTVIYEGDPVYQARKNKSLCVIGASGVMINRLRREVPEGSGINEYIVGFQEYLVPWYKTVESYGFSSGSWRKNAGAESTSIYTGIVENEVDLTEFDEFLLLPSTTGITQSNIGSIEAADIETYFGGLNAVIDYIYTQNPTAKIYLANALHKGNYFTDASKRALMDEINNKLADLAALHSYQLIDLAGGTGINQKTFEHLTYDGTHLNQEGNKIQGLYIRREIIGI